jgi:hypothetical protein
MEVEGGHPLDEMSRIWRPLGPPKGGQGAPVEAFASPPIMKNYRRGKTPVANQEVVGGPQWQWKLG